MLQTYQTLIVGALGFIGVIITMLANAKMQRQQYERKILHEANSLRIALKTELNGNRRSFEGRIKQFEEPVEFGNALIQNRSNDKIYNELLSSIGLLTEYEVEQVTQAYDFLAEIPYRIRVIVSTGEIGGFNDDFISIPKSHQKTVKKIHEVAVPIISKAIEAIDVHLKFS
ncbi:MAG: hypothetical protein PVG66_07765 [Chromatiales bacterium]|jgi:hypothetical protein